MADVSAPTSPRRSRAPQWLFEGIDLIDQRRRALLITFGLVVVVAAVVASIRPAILPPTPVVGAAIGLAALLLATAVLIALDTADLKVRGARHVRAAGGELVAVLPSEPSLVGATDLAEAIEEVRPSDRTLLLGMAAATGDGRRVASWADEVARGLAQRGTSVLSLDLTAADQDQSGFAEVVRDDVKLGSVVELDPEMRLARLGPGRDASEALRAFPEAGRWIPRDLEVLLVALPMAASRAVVRASLSLDQLLIVAERDRTSRVELIAGLDATEAVGTHSQVILIDDAYASYLGVAADVAEDAPGEQDLGEPEGAGGLPSETEPIGSEPRETEPVTDTQVLDGPDPGGAIPPVALDTDTQALVPEDDEPPIDDVLPSGLDEEPGTGAADDEPGVGVADDEPGVGVADDEPGVGVADDEPVVGPGDDEPEPEAEEATGARDVDVMMGAAAASALASVQAYDEPSGPSPEETAPDDADPAQDELTQQVAPHDEPVEEELTQRIDLSGEAAEEPDPISDAVDDTDELTVRIAPPAPLEEDETTEEVERPAADARGEADGQEQDEEDLLNTTARLSLLMEEVAEREEPSEET